MASKAVVDLVSRLDTTSAPLAVSQPSTHLPLCLLVLIVLGLYFTRIADPPLAGEEPRWACGAREMLRTGDWIVPRQQGQVFPERPPLGTWAMAAVALVRGTDVDVLAVRLPSLVAVLLTCLVIYGYSRNFLSPWGALAAGVIYASFGHVLQIGRLGESEALFTLFVSASLLVWHGAYLRRWPPLLMWTCGYALAGLGALVKGPQAPAYFVLVVGAYLAVRRDWRGLFNWRHAAGIAVFALVVGAWQIPFYLTTDLAAVQATWGGLAKDRFIANGFIQHVLTYPLELLICLLPWSPLLLTFFFRRFRDSLRDARPWAIFLATALLVTFPTVLFATLARGRYFMPLYPCLAVLMGLVVERCASDEALAAARRGWRVFLLAWGGVVAPAGVLLAVATFGSITSLSALEQPGIFAALFAALAFITSGVLVWAAWRSGPTRAIVGMGAIVAFTGLFQVGVLVNIQTRRNNPLEENTLAAKAKLPAPGELVSFGPVDHRFVYFYHDPIAELAWPETPEQIPASVTYFCMNRYPGDTPERRANGRGRTWSAVPGTLPVEWETIAEVPFERRLKSSPQPVVVIGKIVRRSPRSEDTPDYRESPDSKNSAQQAELPTTRRRSN